MGGIMANALAERAKKVRVVRGKGDEHKIKQVTLAETMEIRRKIDRASDLDKEIASLKLEHKEKMAGKETELEQLEKDILNFARKADVRVVEGTTHNAVVKPSTSTEIDPFEFYELLNNLKRKGQFFDMVKVKLTEAKKMLGEAMLTPVLKKSTDLWSSIKLELKK